MRTREVVGYEMALHVLAYNLTRSGLEERVPLCAPCDRGAGRILCRPVLGGLHHRICPDLISDRHSRLKSDQGQLFYELHRSDVVPEDHLVRKIDTSPAPSA